MHYGKDGKKSKTEAVYFPPPGEEATPEDVKKFGIENDLGYVKVQVSRITIQHGPKRRPRNGSTNQQGESTTSINDKRMAKQEYLFENQSDIL
jgi:hypothetical protein